ncbi:hypothetical protein P5673_007992 [Acropora cervicornis]|uniref:Uncharacterized protein n=1 Tax=Acropora cervicornis TaxID=6130 RepID=A0AAD9VB91_ACRCE|nr:hypothetical protein P5673_007992 [Acropora cervicornis]
MEDLIEHYFNLGCEQKEILSCLLLIHDENLSSRQLRRILARRGLTRRKHVSNLSTVVNRIERELQCSGRNIGYRSMWQRLVVDHDLVVAKETIKVMFNEVIPVLHLESRFSPPSATRLNRLKSRLR